MGIFSFTCCLRTWREAKRPGGPSQVSIVQKTMSSLDAGRIWYGLIETLEPLFRQRNPQAYSPRRGVLESGPSQRRMCLRDASERHSSWSQEVSTSTCTNGHTSPLHVVIFISGKHKKTSDIFSKHASKSNSRTRRRTFPKNHGSKDTLMIFGR